MIVVHLRAAMLVAVAAALAACDVPRTAEAASPPPAQASPASTPLPAAASIPRAGDDFYDHVNGAWIASYELPADKASFGVFDRMTEEVDGDIRTIIQGLAAGDPAPGTVAAKVADLYAGVMDMKTIEERGLEPLKPHLDRISAIASKQDVVRAWARPGYASPVNLGADAHPDDPDRPALWLSQGGLGMPHSGYYLDFGFKEEGVRQVYRRYIASVMRLLGNENPQRAASRIFALEHKIARAHDLFDRRQSVNQLFLATDLAGLKRAAPSMDWELFLTEAGYGHATSFVIADQTGVPDGVKLLDSVPLQDWKDWLAFHLVDSFNGALPDAFAAASFEFHFRTMLGMEKQEERWRLAVMAVNLYLGDALGQLYVDGHFPAGHRRQVEEMVENIRAAFAARIATLDWMDDPTRAAAMVKLNAAVAHIGYPREERDYSSLKIDRGNLFESVYNVLVFNARKDAAALTRPVDKDAWPLPPQIVNAFYNPLANRLYLPAGILQAPFFDPAGDTARNYGGLGAIIGHEISHGFDDQGRQFDEHGARRDWWTPETNDRFTAFADGLIYQYNAYCPAPGVCVNGLGTLGENIGDLAGLEIAYAAWRKSLNGVEAPVIDGLSGDQRFFIAYAESYREKAREEWTRVMISTDSHAPNRYRVNGIVRNMDAWYAAFDIQPGDKLYLPPEERIRIW